MSHSRFSPSASKRWLHCPGSVQLIESARANGKDMDKSSVAAQEGTLAHAWAERALNAVLANPEQDWHTTAEHRLRFCNQPMRTYVMGYVDYVLDVWARSNGGQLWVERKVMHDPYHDVGGTSDGIVVAADGSWFQIIDLKYGVGKVPVGTRNDPNTQLAVYGLSTLGLCPDATDAYMTIYQPRVGYVETLHMTVDELLTFGEQVVDPAVQAALAPDAACKPNPGACYWCPVKTECAPYHSQRAKRLFASVLDA